MPIPEPGPLTEVEAMAALRKVPALKHDLTDRVVGKCKVVGYVGRPPSCRKTHDDLWLIRCSCGGYEVIAYKNLFYYMGPKCKSELTCKFCKTTQCRVCGTQIKGDLRKRLCGPKCSNLVDDAHAMRSALRRRTPTESCDLEFKGLVRNPIRLLNLNPHRMMKVYQYKLDHGLTEEDMQNSFTRRFHPILGMVLRMGADIYARMDDYREVMREELKRIDDDIRGTAG